MLLTNNNMQDLVAFWGYAVSRAYTEAFTDGEILYCRFECNTKISLCIPTEGGRIYRNVWKYDINSKIFYYLMCP